MVKNRECVCCLIFKNKTQLVGEEQWGKGFYFNHRATGLVWGTILFENGEGWKARGVVVCMEGWHGWRSARSVNGRGGLCPLFSSLTFNKHAPHHFSR